MMIEVTKMDQTMLLDIIPDVFGCIIKLLNEIDLTILYFTSKELRNKINFTPTLYIRNKICVNAAVNCHLQVLKWAKENKFYWSSYVSAIAAYNGHLHILKWAMENGCNWNEWICAFAAENGHLNVLKWARENGCPWDYRTCLYAGTNCQLDCLKWAIENGCPWNSLADWYNADMNGHLEILKLVKWFILKYITKMIYFKQCIINLVFE